MCCDLLKNSYLCLLNNTLPADITITSTVVICWKIRIFAYWTTPLIKSNKNEHGCDLLKNSYLCLLNNTYSRKSWHSFSVVICWKIRIFAYWTTPEFRENPQGSYVVICWKIRIFAYWTTPHEGIHTAQMKLWFAEKFVSLLIEQHRQGNRPPHPYVVICWKIRIFAYWTTPSAFSLSVARMLWFAEKFVSLLIEQHLEIISVLLS